MLSTLEKTPYFFQLAMCYFYWHVSLNTFKVLQRAFIYFYHLNKFVVVQSLWLVRLFVILWTAACLASLPFTNSRWRSCSYSCPWVSEAIQPSHPLLSPFPPAFNLSQHQGLFKWVSSLHQVAKVLELQLQHQSFQWIFRTDFLQTSLNSSKSKELSTVFSNSTFQSIDSSALSFLYGPTLCP